MHKKSNIHKESNPQPSIIRELPLSFETRLNNLSSGDNVFHVSLTLLAKSSIKGRISSLIKIPKKYIRKPREYTAKENSPLIQSAIS